MPVVPCTVVQPVFGIVNFDATEFLTLYPEFTGIYLSAPLALTNNFTIATLLLNNTCGSRVQDANQRLSLLYLLVAHLTSISNGTNDAGVGSPAFSGTAFVSPPNTLTVLTVLSGALVLGASLYDGPSVGNGQLLPGASIITAFGSGTGGIGTYTLNSSLGSAIATENMIVPGVPNVTAPLGIVGRINNASEGDVSVAAEFAAPPNASMAYYIQTKYGAQYWTATSRFRTMLIIPAPPGGTPLLGPYGNLFGGGCG
jgi:hypothetical protein